MKIVNCKVIQDLLPSYIDKISSQSTNMLIEEHLKTCENCTRMLEEMNKEPKGAEIIDQEEKIDYLKGYKKNKSKAVVFSILLTIITILGIYLLLEFILPYAFHNVEFFVSVDDINIEYMYRTEGDSLAVFLYSEKHKELEPYTYNIKINKGLTSRRRL